MHGFLLLIGAAVLLRLCGAFLRRGDHNMAFRAAGWLAVMSAAWLIASAFGAWSAWWPAVIMAAAGTLLAIRWQGQYLNPLFDVMTAGLTGLLSIPTLSPGYMALAVGATTLTGLIADQLAYHVNFRLPVRPILLIGLLAIAALLLANSQAAIHGFQTLGNDVLTVNQIGSGLSVFPRSRLLFLGVAPTVASMGERIVLDTGSVAWLDRPAGKGQHPGIVYFHGSGRLGSIEPTSIAFRRAAVDAGFIVLSLDHVGIGQSPRLDLNAGIVAWNPLPSDVAAVEKLQSMPDVSSVFVAGYSMGADDVLRVLPAVSGIDAAILLGASAIPPVDHNLFWYDDFLFSRGLDARFSEERYDEVIERYYDSISLSRNLPADHPPILIINFEYEFDNVISRQDDLFEAIAGCKHVWLFADTTHLFDLADTAGLTIGDTRAGSQLSEKLDWLQSTMAQEQISSLCN
jgi:dienelactone hydrolase